MIPPHVLAWRGTHTAAALAHTGPLPLGPLRITIPALPELGIPQHQVLIDPAGLEPLLQALPPGQAAALRTYLQTRDRRRAFHVTTIRRADGRIDTYLRRSHRATHALALAIRQLGRHTTPLPTEPRIPLAQQPAPHARAAA